MSASSNGGGASLVLRVCDDGCGLTSTSGGEGSSGVGIANARRRLERMYGSAAELSVRNRPNAPGVEVTITLPLARELPSAPVFAQPRVEVTV
jgi:signal transduction histidine kinase